MAIRVISSALSCPARVVSFLSTGLLSRFDFDDTEDTRTDKRYDCFVLTTVFSSTSLDRALLKHLVNTASEDEGNESEENQRMIMCFSIAGLLNDVLKQFADDWSSLSVLVTIASYVGRRTRFTEA